MTCNDIERDTANLYNNVTLQRKARKNEDAVEIILFKIDIYHLRIYMRRELISMSFD